jgi:hypothetical protein
MLSPLKPHDLSADAQPQGHRSAAVLLLQKIQKQARRFL